MLVRPGTQTVRQPPSRVASESEVRRDYDRFGVIGHSSSLQPASRLQQDVRGSDGTLYPKGTAIPQRADFNTLDNPFTKSAIPSEVSATPAAGLHFIAFAPTSDLFNRARRAMDGQLGDGSTLPIDARAPGQGFNSFVNATHRQNFVVPPRALRSFPLADKLPATKRA
jgi:hypothetical protein